MIGTCFELIILWKTSIYAASIDWWLGESIDEVQIEEKRCFLLRPKWLLIYTIMISNQ
jgi:hypothetical protein